MSGEECLFLCHTGHVGAGWAWGARETQVPSLGQEDPLEEGMTTHSSILAWRIPWTEEPSRLQSMGSQELDTTWQLNQETLFLL